MEYSTKRGCKVMKISFLLQIFLVENSKKNIYKAYLLSRVGIFLNDVLFVFLAIDVSASSEIEVEAFFAFCIFAHLKILDVVVD